FDRRRHSRRRRVHRRQDQSHWCRCRRPDTGAGGRLPDLSADFPGLADRSPGRGSHHRAGAAGTREHQGEKHMKGLLGRLGGQPWIGSFLAAGLVWILAVVFAGGHGGGEILSSALAFATFTVIVGLGQMMVITTGPGNVDLSIPATMTLSGVIAMKLMDTESASILVGITAAMGASFLVGLAHYCLIRLLRIPLIIATLSSSFLVLSTAISVERGLRIKPPPPLADFATARAFGIPIAAIAVAALTGIIG